MRRVPKFSQGYLAAPVLALVVGLLMSFAAAYQVSRVATAKDQERFDYTVALAEDGLSARLNTYVAMLQAGAGFLNANGGQVDRDSFRRFVERLQLADRYPGIQGIGYSVRLPVGDPSQAAPTLRAFGAADVDIRPAGSREEAHAIVHLEPMDRRNRAALGYDMFSEAKRRAAMERARDTGHAAASGRVKLVQEIDEHKQAGFLIYVPVYRGGGIPETVAARRARLAGFVYSPFRADDLLRGVFGSTDRPRLHLTIYDGEKHAGNLLYRSAGARPASPRHSTERTLVVAGQPWTVVYATRPQFEVGSSRPFAPLVLLGGLLATGVLTAAALAEARARRTSDGAAAALRRKARELEILNQAGGRLAADLDPNRLVQQVTDAGREISGAAYGAFFYNIPDDRGGRYRLFSLSGAPREAFSGFDMPRVTEIFGPTFRGESVVRSADITQDPRYGQGGAHGGMPPGHLPVRSYLAVPVISRSGEVLGGLFFGHPDPGVFAEHAEHTVVALAGHAAVAIDNARLFQAAQAEIEARRRIEDQQQLLLDELNHRVKNTLATVQSIAAQTLRATGSPEAFRTAFEARLIALSEAHNLLSRENWRGASLRDLIARELTPHGLGDEGRIQLTGPEVWLQPAMALTLGMAVHELATNAARHGSLASAGGRLTLTWSISDSGGSERLRIEWSESGGATVKPPSRRGFGSRLLERGLRGDLGGEARLTYRPDGLHCIIEAPLPGRSAAA